MKPSVMLGFALLSGCTTEAPLLVEATDEALTFAAGDCSSCVKVKDLFAGSGSLLAHVPDVGKSWVEVFDNLNRDPVIGSGVLRAATDSNNRGQAYIARPDPATATQAVQVTLAALDTSNGTKPVGLFGRRTDDNNFYFVQILPNAHSQASVQLYRRASGKNTRLASADVTLSPGDTITLSLGDGAKAVLVDGVEVVSSPDNTLTQAGTWGLFLGGYQVSGHVRSSWALDGFIAAEGAPTTEPPPPDDEPPPPDDEPPPPDDDPPPPDDEGSDGIWIAAGDLATRPTSGSAWNALLSAANKTCGTPNLANQDDPTNVCIMAKALVYARIGGETTYRKPVADAIRSIIANPGCDGSSTCQPGKYVGRALALGRELAAYVIAADLIDLHAYDATLDAQFRAKLDYLRTAPTSGGPKSLIDCHNKRPNNWGTHCGASRAAVAAYLGDATELANTARVFRGFVGDRTAYAGFSYGDLCWQANPSAPVGILPKGATINGYNVDGVLPDDQRRWSDPGACQFTYPFPKENYVYESLQGALAMAIILDRAGYDAFSWQDSALRRAFTWLHAQANFPATGDDTWEPHVVNHFYNTSFPAPVPSRPGKNVGFTDWTHP